MRVWQGRSYPPGATWDGAGVNFALFSEHATKVELCLFDGRDNAGVCPLASVLDTAFTWGDDRPPRNPWHQTVIYELHVKGFSQRMPGVPEELRGTYAALGTEAAVDHLQGLGVTAVELMP